MAGTAGNAAMAHASPTSLFFNFMILPPDESQI
jgi:hypothetical protein